jgi:hypothetical protein
MRTTGASRYGPICSVERHDATVVTVTRAANQRKSRIGIVTARIIE